MAITQLPTEPAPVATLTFKSVLPESRVSQVHGRIKKIRAKGEQISLKQEEKKNGLGLAVVLNKHESTVGQTAASRLHLISVQK